MDGRCAITVLVDDDIPPKRTWDGRDRLVCEVRHMRVVDVHLGEGEGSNDLVEVEEGCTSTFTGVSRVCRRLEYRNQLEKHKVRETSAR